MHFVDQLVPKPGRAELLKAASVRAFTLDISENSQRDGSLDLARVADPAHAQLDPCLERSAAIPLLLQPPSTKVGDTHPFRPGHRFYSDGVPRTVNSVTTLRTNVTQRDTGTHAGFEVTHSGTGAS